MLKKGPVRHAKKRGVAVRDQVAEPEIHLKILNCR